MRLYRFEIENFRRIRKASIRFGDATFFIGENNVGKSSVFRALEKFFTAGVKCEQQDFFTKDSGEKFDKIMMTGEFINLPPESITWPGFKGRVLIKEADGIKDYRILYRKTYSQNGDVKKEMKIHRKYLKQEFEDCQTLSDFINKGITELTIQEIFKNNVRDRRLTVPQRSKLDLIEQLWDFDLTTEEWFENPGGIEGNITIKLPRFLLIPAEHKIDEITTPRGVLQKMMLEIFKDVPESSENYKEAQKYLDLLSKELDPKDEEKEFGKMMREVNTIVKEVFAETSFNVATELSDPDKALNPLASLFLCQAILKQPLIDKGWARIRAAVFALLRYRENFLEKRSKGR